MSRVTTEAISKASAMLRGETGLKFALGQIRERERLEMGALESAEIVERNAASDLLEKKSGANYPSINVFCERMENTQTEKFRTFSGTIHMVAEVRVSQDHLEGLERQTRFHAEAITQVLDLNRGDWGNGIFYGGGYRVDFLPVKHGGKNYLQPARISFVLKASVN